MKIFYSSSKNAFFDSGLNYKEMPDDVVEIDKNTLVDLMSQQASGKIITSGSDGLPIAVDPDSPAVSDLLEKVKSEIRYSRRLIMDALTGIGLRAVVSGDDSLAKAASEVSSKLLDITDDPKLNSSNTIEEIRASASEAYQKIFDSADDKLKSAFDSIYQ